jgi:class 3 adenylate cyclase
MDWSDPEARLRLIERVGPTEYARQHGLEIERSTIETVAGRPIRAIVTRWGTLYVVGGTGCGFATLAQAADYAVIVAAADTEDMDEAIASIQQRIGVKTGDVAAAAFSGFDWAQGTPYERIIAIQNWLKLERLYAAEPVGTQ